MALEPYEAYEMARVLMQRVGIIHDLCNHAAYLLQDIDPKTVKWTGEGYSGDQLLINGVAATVAQIKQLANEAYQSAVNYYDLITTFVDNYPTTPDIADALALWNTTGAYIKAKIDTIKTSFLTARNAATAVSTKPELSSIGATLISEVPKLRLVRDFL